jgi:hypothetical protein
MQCYGTDRRLRREIARCGEEDADRGGVIGCAEIPGHNTLL